MSKRSFKPSFEIDALDVKLDEDAVSCCSSTVSAATIKRTNVTVNFKTMNDGNSNGSDLSRFETGEVRGIRGRISARVDRVGLAPESCAAFLSLVRGAANVGADTWARLMAADGDPAAVTARVAEMFRMHVALWVFGGYAVGQEQDEWVKDLWSLALFSRDLRAQVFEHMDLVVNVPHGDVVMSLSGSSDSSSSRSNPFVSEQENFDPLSLNAVVAVVDSGLLGEAQAGAHRSDESTGQEAASDLELAEDADAESSNASTQRSNQLFVQGGDNNLYQDDIGSAGGSSNDEPVDRAVGRYFDSSGTPSIASDP